MNINETRWMLDHFKKDALEVDSERFTWELAKTVSTALFALAVMRLMGYL
jgi:hypothetical protein